MNILVICASRYEAIRFKDALKSVNHTNVYRVIETEQGKVSTAVQTALELFSPSAPHYDLIVVPKFVMSNGFYKTGDLVIPSKCYDSANGFITSYDLQGSDETKLYSLESKYKIDEIVHSVQGPTIFDTETSAICYVADQCDTPVMVFARVVNDNVDYDTLSFTEFVWYVESIS